jgi:hypothetical protein
MSTSIKELMTELYDIQQAIINANAPNAPDQAAQFKEIRDFFSLYWEGIVAALRQCNSFALEVERLQQNLKRMDNGHLIGFLNELVEHCERCKKLAKDLVPLHDASVLQYSIHEEEYRHILRNAVRSRGNRQKKNGNQPNGESAMIKFTTACDALRREVVNMGTFFGGQVLACKDYLSAAKGRRRQIPQEEAKQFANKWKEYRESTIKAITEIQKICDAVVVAAVGNAHPKKSSCIIV